MLAGTVIVEHQPAIELVAVPVQRQRQPRGLYGFSVAAFERQTLRQPREDCQPVLAPLLPGGHRPVFVGIFGQKRAPREPEGFTVLADGVLQLPGFLKRLGPPPVSLELPSVYLAVRSFAKAISGALAEHVVGVGATFEVRLQRPTQLAYRRPEASLSGLGRCARPQRLYDLVARESLARPREQQLQERAALLAAPLPMLDDLIAAPDPELAE